MTVVDVDDLELERVAALGWQAEHRAWRGQWLLRANDGFTGRANSVLPLGDPGLELDVAIGEVASWYAGHGLPPRFAVPAPARDDLRAALVDRGWAPAWGAHVMAAPLGAVAVPDGPHVEVRPRPSPGWQRAYHYRGSRDLPAAGRRLLVRAEVVGFAQVVDGGDVVAIGRGTVVDGWVGITAVEVAPSHRRRGFASRVLGALVEWGQARGATGAYLQVALDNDAALAMYRRAGFVDHHTYDYLDPPASSSATRQQA